MRIIADTNVLLRALLRDDDAQRRAAIEVLKAAETVAISAHSLCEFVWVLSRRYGVPRREIASTIRRLIETHVVVDHAAVAAGLHVLDAGGDFADGVIAHDGRWLGGETFVSLDKKAIEFLGALGYAVEALR